MKCDVKNSRAKFTSILPRPHVVSQSVRCFFLQKVGDWLDARDSDGTWCVAQVVAIEGDSLRVHFQGYSSRYDEDIRLESSKV